MAGRENSNDPTTQDKIHKCKVCKIKFPDIQSYVEHLESKDHKKGIMKEKYGEKYLEAKAKLENNPAHQNLSATEEILALLKDNRKPKLDKDSSCESSEEDDVYPCTLCQKVCTGILNFQLHLEGQKHKKNVKKAKLLEQMKNNNLIPKPSAQKQPKEQSLLDRIMTNTKFASSDIECKTCQKKCSGPESFKQHCKSVGHLKKLAMQNLLEEMKSEGLSPPLNGDDSNFSCYDCQKTFSGLLPYQQHMESITHLKQTRHLEQLSSIKDLIINSEDDAKKIQCKECGKSFSGPVPFNAHLKSFAHEKLKKKSVQMENLKKKHPEMVNIPMQLDPETEDTEEENVLYPYCAACGLVCSGPEAALDHFSSARHKRVVKKKSQLQKYMKHQEAKILTEVSGSPKKCKVAKYAKEANSSNSDNEFDIINQE